MSANIFLFILTLIRM